MIVIKRGESVFWKAVVSCIHKILQISFWRIGDDNLNFWFDNCTENGHLSDLVPMIQNPNLSLADVLQPSNWDLFQLKDLVGASIVPNIINSIWMVVVLVILV